MKYLRKFNESFDNGQIKLIDLFDEYPDEDELIWNYIGQLDFENHLFDISTTKIEDIIYDEFIENFESNSEKWQRDYVNYICSNIDEFKNKPIIVDFDSEVIVDGNHKLIAFYYSNLKYVKTIDINQ